jgi:pyruvate/2-oxoglutarate dehydrogenase complex dihydrolipoamide acyltransferase (E2) component
LDESGENLIIKKYFNLGIAMDTPNGLVVPVIKDVEQKSLVELVNASPFQTGLLTERDTPKIATSGAFTMGVNCW